MNLTTNEITAIADAVAVRIGTKGLPSTLTPTQFAEIMGVAHGKVLGWIRNGDLQAINVADDRNRRPRWRILRNQAEAFIRSRSNRN